MYTCDVLCFLCLHIIHVMFCDVFFYENFAMGHRTNMFFC
jgi:hypothetical protein